MRLGKKRLRSILIFALLAAMIVSGCGAKGRVSDGQDAGKQSESQTEASGDKTTTVSEAPEIPGLTFESEMELTYAEVFRVYNYKAGYSLIDIKDGDQYLVVPEGGDIPEGLDENIVVIRKPLDNIYLAATSAMALFSAIDSLDSIRMSGLDTSGWYIDAAADAMNSGKIIFAGKYNEPDYELLLKEDCDLAIESTMIYHSPKVKEMIEDLDIPVFVDRSSYEMHPLGRTEWIKLYGVLTDKEAEAEAFFDRQAEIISKLKDFKNTGKTVAFFYVKTDGTVVVRRPDDYIPKMIDIAGGKYAFADMNVEGDSTSVSLTMEEFYATAVDADYLVYNGSIDSTVSSLDELYAKSGLFKDFKAVKDGNVWTTGKSMYQATDIVGQLITDLNLMLTGGTEKGMTFLEKVK